MKAALSGFARLTKTSVKGYTIVEVMLVLAISMVLLVAAVAVFRGQQGATQFVQAVQDLNSKIVNIAAQVNAGTFPNSTQYSCTPGSATTPPSFSLGGSNTALGGREGCIFLGRAIHAYRDSNTDDLNIYTIVGNLNDQTGSAATNISDTKPTPATLGGSYILTDTYKLPGGAKIKSVGAEGGAAPSVNSWAMAGIYVNLDPNATNSSGSTQLGLWGYPLGDQTAFQSSTVTSCIDGISCTSSQVSQIDDWKLCIADAGNSHTFLLVIRSNTAGITTQLIDGGC